MPILKGNSVCITIVTGDSKLINPDQHPPFFSHLFTKFFFILHTSILIKISLNVNDYINYEKKLSHTFKNKKIIEKNQCKYNYLKKVQPQTDSSLKIFFKKFFEKLSFSVS